MRNSQSSRSPTRLGSICPIGWRDPFLPAAAGAWATFPALKELFIYDGSGVMPGRTWIIAPDVESLNGALVTAYYGEKSRKERAAVSSAPRKNEPGDKHIRKAISEGLTGHEARLEAVLPTRSRSIQPTRYGFRSFDRQWIIPDARLINQPNPTLWKAHSSRQVYLTALEARSPSSGPAVTFTGLFPDLHHYKGSFGGRVHPLWRDRPRQSQISSRRCSLTLRTLMGSRSRPKTSWLISPLSWRIRLSRRGLHRTLFALGCAFRSQPMRAFSPKLSRSALK